MSTGLIMMLKSLGIDPKMLEGVAKAVQTAAADLHAIKKQNEEILFRLRALTPSIEIPTEGTVPLLKAVNNGG